MTRPSDGLAQELQERIDALESHLFMCNRQPLCPLPGRGFMDELAEMRKLARRLQEREAFYRYIVELATEGIWMLDAEARTSFVNARMTELMHYEPEAMLGRSLFEFMAAGDRKAAEQKFGDRRNGLGERHDFRFVRPDGSAFWAELSTKPLFDSEWGFLGCLGMVTDITSRRATEAALRSLNEDLEGRVVARVEDLQRQAFAMDATQEGMALLEGDCYVYMNPAHAVMYGYAPDELTGRSWQSLYCPEQIAWFQAAVFPQLLRDRRRAVRAGSARVSSYVTTWGRHDGPATHAPPPGPVENPVPAKPPPYPNPHGPQHDASQGMGQSQGEARMLNISTMRASDARGRARWSPPHWALEC